MGLFKNMFGTKRKETARERQNRILGDPFKVQKIKPSGVKSSDVLAKLKPLATKAASGFKAASVRAYELETGKAQPTKKPTTKSNQSILQMLKNASIRAYEEDMKKPKRRGLL